MLLDYNKMESNVRIIVKGKEYEGSFSCCRVNKDTVPKGLWVYSIRESDDTGEPATIEKYVGVNHYGDFVTKTPIPKLESEEVDYLHIEYFECKLYTYSAKKGEEKMNKQTTNLSEGVNNPSHYTANNPTIILDKDYKKGDVLEIRCIDVIRNWPNHKANPTKYIWRSGDKIEAGMTAIDMQIKDYQKAVWYLNDKIEELIKVREHLKNK